MRIPKLNNYIASGRLTKKPELRYLDSGKAIANFTIAIDDSYKKDGEWQNKAVFMPVTLFDKQAEYLSGELDKGSPVIVEGSIKQDRWTDQDGGHREKIYILANRVHLLEKPEEQNVAKGEIE